MSAAAMTPVAGDLGAAAPEGLDGAVVRSWSYDGDTFTWSLLVRSGEHGYLPLTMTYTGAFFLRGDDTALPGVPLEAGRSYVVHAQQFEEAELGGFHRVAFWPTPQFRIGYLAMTWEQRARSLA